MPRWIKYCFWALSLLALPLAWGGLRAFLSHDPFGYFTDKWADPFGGNIGSVMKDVDATVYEKGDKKASFSADQVEIRRDKQFMDLFGLKNGKVFEGDKEQATFNAGRATFNAAEELMMIFGGAKVESENFALETPDAKLDIKNKRAVMSNGIEGTAFKGAVKAGTLELGFGTGTHKATAVEWRGAPKIEGVPQARDVQFRADEVEYTNDPNVIVYKNAEAIDEDALMRAKTITYNGKEDTITLDGGAEYYGAEVIVSAPKVVVLRKQKKATASGPTGSVYFLVKPEGQKGIPVVQKMPAQPELPPGLSQPDSLDELRSAENLRKYPIVVTSSKVDYSYAKGAKKAIMTGEPKALQQLRGGVWREVTAPRAEFEEEKEILNLFSTGDSKEVRMRNSAGDDFIALSVRMGTTLGKETLSGKGIEGVMKVRDEEVPRAGGGGG